MNPAQLHQPTVTREALRSTIELARARGAAPVIVVPQFTPEGAEEREIRSRVLDEAGLRYVWVDLDGSWRVPDDGHPDARAAHAFAVAIADKLRSEGVSPGDESSKKRDLEFYETIVIRELRVLHLKTSCRPDWRSPALSCTALVIHLSVAALQEILTSPDIQSQYGQVWCEFIAKTYKLTLALTELRLMTTAAVCAVGCL